MPQRDLYVRSVALAGLPEFIKKFGGNPAQLFAEVELNLADLKNGSNFISWPKACDLLELASKVLEEPQFGLKWALELPDDFQNAGPIMFLASIVPDMRSLVKLMIEYEKIHSNGHVSKLTEYPERGLASWTIYTHPLTPISRQYSEHIMAVVAQMASRTMDGFKFESVYFQHSAPINMDVHEKIFQCPVHFDAEDLKIYGDIAGLDRKVGGSLKRLKPLLNIYLNRQIKKTPIPIKPMTHTVSQTLPSLFGAKQSGANSVALFLNVSPKKMQRLLKEEGTNFSEVKDNVRRQMAKRLLTESNMSLGHLAGLLDYASAEAFNSACQRWFGQSPRQYRQDAKR